MLSSLAAFRPAGRGIYAPTPVQHTIGEFPDGDCSLRCPRCTKCKRWSEFMTTSTYIPTLFCNTCKDRRTGNVSVAPTRAVSCKDFDEWATEVLDFVDASGSELVCHQGCIPLKSEVEQTDQGDSESSKVSRHEIYTFALDIIEYVTGVGFNLKKSEQYAGRGDEARGWSVLYECSHSGTQAQVDNQCGKAQTRGVKHNEDGTTKKSRQTRSNVIQKRVCNGKLTIGLARSCCFITYSHARHEGVLLKKRLLTPAMKAVISSMSKGATPTEARALLQELGYGSLPRQHIISYWMKKVRINHNDFYQVLTTQ